MKIKKFWLKESKLIKWLKPPLIAYKKNSKNIYNWFPDGKINIYNNFIERNLKNNKNKVAIKYFSKSGDYREYTYNHIYLAVENLSYSFSKNKIKNVLIHGASSFETTIAIFFCLKNGIKFSVILEDLPKEAILARVKIFKPDLIITRSTDSKYLKNIFNIFKKYKTKKNCILYFLGTKRLVNNIKFINIKNLIKPTKSTKKSTKSIKSFSTSFILFTSGSTGQPKGIIHSTGGYFFYGKYTCKKQFGMNKNSVVLTASDAVWIKGNTYALFGPLSFGSTTILLESPMLILNSSFLVEIIKKHKISILYLPVTLIRLMRATFGKFHIENKSLKAIGSMGEPLAKDVADWFSNKFTKNKLSVVNTYFQTETGGIISSPKFNDKPVKDYNGTVGKPINNFIKKKLNKKENEIKLTQPWPGSLKGVINGKSFFNKYWDKNGYFRMFDLGKFDKNKNLIVLGRNDDVINVRGHRIGSGQIESEVIKIKNIKETCAVSIKDDLEGYRIVVFYTSKRETIIDDIIDKRITEVFGNYAQPKYIIKIDELPKTKSGKILRRLLRNILNNPNFSEFGDLSTINNKNLVNNIIKSIRQKIIN